MAILKKLRKQQHLPQRDGVKVREVAALKRENHHLAKQNARLRKQVEQATATKNEFEVLEAMEPINMQGAVLTPELIQEAHDRSVTDYGSPGCECGSPMRLVDLGRMQMWVCPLCKSHRKVA